VSRTFLVHHADAPYLDIYQALDRVINVFVMMAAESGEYEY